MDSSRISHKSDENARDVPIQSPDEGKHQQTDCPKLKESQDKEVFCS